MVSSQELFNYRLNLKLNENYKFIKEQTVYTVLLYANSNTSIKLNYYITFEPESLQRMDTRIYPYAERNILTDFSYNPTEQASDNIIPGTTALLSLNVYPSYANFDYIEVTNASISFEQLLRNDTASGYPYETLSDRNYLTNGITLVNEYYSDGKIIRGVNGEYYVSMLLPSTALASSYTITLKAYRDISGVKTLVYTKQVVLESAYLPGVTLFYKGEVSSNGNEIYVPHGTTSELTVSLKDYTGNVSFDITSDGLSYPYATITKTGNKYYLILIN